MLALLGGLAGAFGGALIGLGLVALIGGGGMPTWKLLQGVLGTAGVVGFGVGLVSGPVLSWTLLRRAPIWRAIGEPAVGAGLGASISFAFSIGFWPMIGVALATATLAALRLRRSVNRPSAVPTS